MPSVGQLAGRLAIVTGAASGIGRSVCQVFAREGAKVAAVDINASALDDTLSTLKTDSPGDHHGFAADVSLPLSVSQLLHQVQTQFQATPTVAVNSAGIIRDNLLLRSTDEDFDKVINVNLKGTYLVMKAVTQAMVKEKVPCGSVINIASIVGKCGNIGQTNYAASKAGVVGLSKSAAKELSRFNIRVNSVLPGYIQTNMTDHVPKKVLDKIVEMIPMGRIGSPEDVAELCLFLASQSSGYITGASIEVTGGMNF
ncbi:estradiol 17-beta-dehydrogenase 8-like [Argonauta hians]